MIASIGGKLHPLFFCFGEDDVVALIKAPVMASCAFVLGDYRAGQFGELA